MRPLGIYLCDILIEIQTCSLKKMHLKMSCVKWRLLRLGCNVLTKHEESINLGPVVEVASSDIRKFIGTAGKYMCLIFLIREGKFRC